MYKENANELMIAVQAVPSIDQSLLARIRRDPFYASAYDILGSVEDLYDAGFFDDRSGRDPAELPRASDDWMMTPVYKIRRRLDSLGEVPAGQKLAVLLLTGSFCPVHRGHIEAMEIARKELEARNIVVLGGYLSPSHDEYVSIKCGDQTLSAAHRLHLCQAALAESDWLMADGWEALGVDRAINFSDVIVRLESYLAAHVETSQPIDVHYVFSGDHARFSRAFIAHGQCVCVPRTGYEDAMRKYALAPYVKGNQRIIFADQKLAPFSSYEVRHGDHAQMNKASEKIYKDWISRSNDSIESAFYYLRNEGAWATSRWCESRDAEQISRAWERFCRELVALFKHVHRQVDAPDICRELDFEILDLPNQRAYWLQMLSSVQEKIISLDACIEGDFNLSVARHFPLSAGVSGFKIGSRPSCPALAEQVKTIPAGDYIIFDDDIVTGATVRAVRDLPFPPGVNIVGQQALVHRDIRQPIDILDCRDFLVGARKGGLVVEMPDGSLARAPYCLPYVSPAVRASVPLSAEIVFSEVLWRLNEKFFAAVDSPPLLLQDAGTSFQRLMGHIGFAPSTPLTTICSWHAERLFHIGR